MSRMLSKMNLISVVQQLPKEDTETIQGYVEMVDQENNAQKVMIENFVTENQELKKQIETLEKTNNQLISKLDRYDAIVDERDELKKQLEEYQEEVCILDMRTDENIKYRNQQKEFISYLESEKDRLARECSQIYEDSLCKTRLVNEDIFNEVDTILSKYQEIIGVENENSKD